MFRDDELLETSDPRLRAIAGFSTMAKWRMQRIGPAFMKLSRGRILYSGADLNSWLAAKRIEPDMQRAANE